MWLGRRSWSRDLSSFKIEAIFASSGAERRVVEERLGPVLKTARALQIGFLRVTGDCKAAELIDVRNAGHRSGVPLQKPARVRLQGLDPLLRAAARVSSRTRVGTSPGSAVASCTATCCQRPPSAGDAPSSAARTVCIPNIKRRAWNLPQLRKVVGPECPDPDPCFTTAIVTEAAERLGAPSPQKRG